MAVLYMANGVNTAKWTPEGQGKDFTFSPTLEPLQDLKDQILVISNLWNAAANTGDGHYVKESSLLTCTTISKTLGIDINMHGVSMDQVAAQRVGEQTPLPPSNSESSQNRPASMLMSAIRECTDATSPGAIRLRRWLARSIRCQSTSGCSGPPDRRVMR